MIAKSLCERLDELVREAYPDARTRLHEDSQGRVFGTVVSGSFEGVDEADRQHAFYELVGSKLGPETKQLLLVIFTNTPSEDALFERDAQPHVG